MDLWFGEETNFLQAKNGPKPSGCPLNLEQDYSR